MMRLGFEPTPGKPYNPPAANVPPRNALQMLRFDPRPRIFYLVTATNASATPVAPTHDVMGGFS